MPGTFRLLRRPNLQREKEPSVLLRWARGRLQELLEVRLSVVLSGAFGVMAGWLAATWTSRADDSGTLKNDVK